MNDWIKTADVLPPESTFKFHPETEQKVKTILKEMNVL